MTALLRANPSRALLRANLSRALLRDERGATAVFSALSLAAVLGFVALGVDSASAIHAQRRIQAGADAAALGAALALRAEPGTNPLGVAAGLLAENGVSGSVDTQWPPRDGPLARNPAAVRVRVTAPSPARLGAFTGVSSGVIAASATAVLKEARIGCILALMPGDPDAISVPRPADLSLDHCTTISAADGLSPLRLAEADPWRDITLPGLQFCSTNRLVVAGAQLLSAATLPMGLCNGVTVPAGASLKLGPGTYLVTGQLKVEPGGILAGEGVTLVLRGGGSVNFQPGATVALAAPVVGATAGLAIVAASSVSGTSWLQAAAGQRLVGAVRLPGQALHFAGSGNSACTQLIARSVHISGPSVLRASCAATAVKPLVDRVAQLAE